MVKDRPSISCWYAIVVGTGIALSPIHNQLTNTNNSDKLVSILTVLVIPFIVCWIIVLYPYYIALAWLRVFMLASVNRC